MASVNHSDSIANGFRDAFVKPRRLKEYTLSARAITAVLTSGGAKKSAVKALIGNERNCGFNVCGPLLIGTSMTFDHDEVWGRGGTAMAIIGQPYSATREYLQQLETIRGLGIAVTIDKDSHYGHGTYRFIVWHADLARECGLDPAARGPFPGAVVEGFPRCPEFPAASKVEPKPPALAMKSHPLETAVRGIFAEHPALDRINLAVYLCGSTHLRPNRNGRRLGMSGDRAYRVVAEDVLGCMESQGKVYRDGHGWYRLV